MQTALPSSQQLQLHLAGHNFLVKGMDCYDNSPYYCLVYVAKGSQEFSGTDGQLKAAPAGSFMIYSPGIQYRRYTDEKVGENYWILFQGMEHAIFNRLKLSPDTLYHITPSDEINEIFDRMIEEILHDRPQHQLIAETLFIQLLIQL